MSDIANKILNTYQLHKNINLNLLIPNLCTNDLDNNNIVLSFKLNLIYVHSTQLLTS